jgi:hypothetical protein
MEILYSIFREAHKSDPNTAFTISQVDTYLRQVTMSEGSLWSIIDIGHGQSRTFLQLQRSLDAPLEINIPFHIQWPLLPSFMHNVQWLLDVLAPLTRRIRTLHITAFEEESSPDAINVRAVIQFLFSHEFPILESVELGLLNTHCVEPHQEIPVLVEPDPQTDIYWPLRSVSLSHFMPSPQTRLISGSTTRLEICETDLPTARLVYILSQAPMLEHLRLVDVYDSVDRHRQKPATRPVALQHLTTLQILWSSCSWLGTMNYVDTPALNSVEFQTREYTDNLEYAWACLLDVAKGNPQLRELRIRGLVLDASGWSELFNSLPSITYLRIASSCLQDADLAPLADGREGACPNLTHIILQNELSLTSGPILAMVMRRNSQIDNIFAALVHVSLQGFDVDKIREIDYDSLSKLVPSLVVETFDGDDLGSDRDTSEYTTDGSDDVSDFDEYRP